MKYMDMLASLGIGNAHPGGFAETLRQLQKYPIPVGSNVLEVGCGTGRTSCHLANLGYRVTALDIRQDMLEKAKIRAKMENVDVRFVWGDAGNLPFDSVSFDVVIVESVSIFTDITSAISEYYRVLKPNGKLYDREVLLLKELPNEAWNEISGFYGVATLLNNQQWIELMGNAQFKTAAVDGPYPFPVMMNEDLQHYPDNLQQINPGQLMNPHIWKLQAEYDDIMQRYHDYIGYGIMIGSK